MEIRNVNIVIGYDDEEGSRPEVLGVFETPDESHRCAIDHQGEFDHIMDLLWID
jgi:hypothetical protein